MLTDYGNSFQSLPEQSSIGQRLPGSPLDPAASHVCEQLLFRFAQRRAGGRPNLPVGESRTVVMTIRMTPAEAASLRSEAEKCSISVSTLIVIHALQRKPPRIVAPITIATYRQISGIAANVNQLTHRANAGTIGDEELVTLFDKVRNELAAFITAFSTATQKPEIDE